MERNNISLCKYFSPSGPNVACSLEEVPQTEMCPGHLGTSQQKNLEASVWDPYPE